MFHTTYTGKGLVGLLKEGGSRRRAALTQTIEAMGGSVEELYYAFGDTDLYIICDLPDDATATAVSLNNANAGALDIRATVLITPETVDEAVTKKVPYRPPGDPRPQVGSERRRPVWRRRPPVRFIRRRRGSARASRAGAGKRRSHD